MWMRLRWVDIRVECNRVGGVKLLRVAACLILLVFAVRAASQMLGVDFVAFAHGLYTTLYARVAEGGG